jgi:hypothetical protein
MFISEFSDRFNVWKMRYSPIKLDKIRQYLMYYPKKEESEMIFDGFKYGFYINYNGPISFDSKNLKSSFKSRKIESEIIAGRIVGPFDTRPISNLRCSPIGLTPKKTGVFG